MAVYIHRVRFICYTFVAIGFKVEEARAKAMALVRDGVSL